MVANISWVILKIPFMSSDARRPQTEGYSGGRSPDVEKVVLEILSL